MPFFVGIGDPMGLLSWLFAGPSPVTVADRVWLTRAAKVAGVVGDLKARGPDVQLVMLVAHFPDTLAAMADDLNRAGLGLSFLGDRGTARDVLATADREIAEVLVALEKQLCEMRQLPAETESPGLIRIVAPERHLLPGPDEGIVGFAKVLGRRCDVRFHSSLDDPLMRMFAGEWVADTLRRLGLKDSDPIESVLVERRIKSAQQKLAKRVPEPRDADSAEEWLRVNGVG